MSKEIERKFLCSSEMLPDEIHNIEPEYIRQGVVLSGNNHDTHLRIRIIDDKKAFLCLKNKTSKIERDEFEYEIPIKDGLKIFRIADPTIEKERYTFKYKKYTIYYDDFGFGLYTAEIEFNSESEADAFEDYPDYFIKEVTHINQYDLLEKHKKINGI